MKAYDHVAEYKAYHTYIRNVSRIIDQWKISLRDILEEMSALT